MDTLDEERNKLQIERLVQAIQDFHTDGTEIDTQKILTPKVGDKTLRDSLIELWESYRVPRHTPASFMSYFNAVVNERRIINQQRRQNAQDHDIGAEVLDFNDSAEKQKEKILEDSDRYWGLCPFRNDFTIQLQYKKGVELESFEKAIKYYGQGHSKKTMALPATLKNLMNEAIYRGLSHKKIGQLLVLFCAKHFDEMDSIVEAKLADHKYKEIYVELVKRCSTKQEKIKIDNAFQALVRKPGEDISTIVGRLENLSLHSIEVVQPALEESKKLTRCAQHVLGKIRHLINQETLTLYEAWVDKAAGQTTITVAKAVAEIQRIESMGSKYQITQERRLPKTAATTEIVSISEQEVGVNNIRSRYFYDKADKPKRSRNQNSRSSTPNRNQRRSRRDSFDQSRRSPSSNPSSRNQTPVNNLTSNSSRSQTPTNRTNSDQGARTPTPTGMPRNCYRCGSSQHLARECFRYSSTTKDACWKCKRNGVQLFHDAFNCRFYKNNSNYKSPSASQRTSREQYHRNARNQPKN